MRHRKVSRKLGRDVEHHWAILSTQVRDLLKHGKIVTTLAKAKELRRIADKMITLAKKGDLASRRRALAFIKDKNIVKKLFNEIRAKYIDRPGGYTRIVKIGKKRGDGSDVAIVELVEEKLTMRPSKVKKDRIKKILDFIEEKKKKYGISQLKDSSQKESHQESE